MLLELTTEESPDGVRIALAGELDVSGATTFYEALSRAEQSGAALIVLDLRELRFMDSTGLRLIVAAHRRAIEDARRLVIVQGPDAIRELFRVAGLDQLLEIVEDPAALGGGESA
jgi:anti-anti-sigma factor